MVRKHTYGYSSGLELGPPLFKAFDNSKQLLVVDLIIAFGGVQVLREEGYGVE